MSEDRSSPVRQALEDAKLREEAEERARLERARNAALAGVTALPVDMGELVPCRVLPMGANKVSMGVHIAGVGEALYDRGAELDAPAKIARELELRGFVEIMPARRKKADAEPA